MQHHHLVDQFLSRATGGKRLLEVADVGLAAAEDRGRIVVARVRALMPGDDDPGIECLDLLDASDPLQALSWSICASHGWMPL